MLPFASNADDLTTSFGAANASAGTSKKMRVRMLRRGATHVPAPDLQALTAEVHMRKTSLSFPFLALIALTRGLLGVGVGLLLSRRIPEKRRLPVGATLASVGALSTIPIAFTIFRNKVKAGDAVA
jgi:hypothetical protein